MLSGSRRPRSLRQALLLCTAVAWLAPPAFAGEMVFTTILDPTKVGLGPGPDGLFGVGVDDDLSSFGLNPTGSVSYVFLDGINFPPTGQLINFGEGTLSFDAPPLAVPFHQTDFDLAIGDTIAEPPVQEIVDRPDVTPHYIVFAGDGTFFSAYTVAVCPVGIELELCDPNLEVDSFANGWVWRPGIDDPTTLPFVDQTGFEGDAFPDFLEYLETLVPPEATMILVQITPIIPMTESNTRGAQADIVRGGTYFSLLAAYSTDPVPQQIDCTKNPDVCGLTLDLSGKESTQACFLPKVKTNPQLRIVLASKTWAGRDQRGLVHFGKYKADSKGRNLKLKYDLGDLLFIIDSIWPEPLQHVIQKKTATLETKLNKRRTKVKEARMKVKGTDFSEPEERRVRYKLQLEGTATPQ